MASIEGRAVARPSGPRVGGVLGDSCSTFVDGEPTAERTAAMGGPAELDRGLALLRPGTRSGDVDAAVAR